VIKGWHFTPLTLSLSKGVFGQTGIDRLSLSGIVYDRFVVRRA
jgi:hypothetical protein